MTLRRRTHVVFLDAHVHDADKAGPVQQRRGPVLRHNGVDFVASDFKVEFSGRPIQEAARKEGEHFLQKAVDDAIKRTGEVWK